MKTLLLTLVLILSTMTVSYAQNRTLEQRTLNKITKLRGILDKLESDVQYQERFDLVKAHSALKNSLMDLRAARVINDGPLPMPGYFSIGQRVLYINLSGTHYLGTVKALAGNEAQIKFDRFVNPEWKKTAKLVAFVDCTEDKCIGDRILYTNISGTRYEGIIKQAFANNRVQIKFDRFVNPEFKAVDHKLAKEVRSCLRRFCVGDKILYINTSGTRYKGVIKKLFDNGIAKIKFDRFVNPEYKQMRDLTPLHQ